MILLDGELGYSDILGHAIHNHLHVAGAAFAETKRWAISIIDIKVFQVAVETGSAEE